MFCISMEIDQNSARYLQDRSISVSMDSSGSD